MKVEFHEKGRPPWATKRRVYSVNFDLSVDQLHAAAESLRDDLQRFPPRDDSPLAKRRSPR